MGEAESAGLNGKDLGSKIASEPQEGNVEVGCVCMCVHGRTIF